MSKFMKLFVVAMFSAGVVFLVSFAWVKTESALAADESASFAENLNRTIKVTVSKRGYEPKSIAVKKGQRVKLAFLRTDEQNCGGEVVFPRLNISRKLPVGETVMIEFTPRESGEIGFFCGMNMLRGKVLVQ